MDSENVKVPRERASMGIEIDKKRQENDSVRPSEKNRRNMKKHQEKDER